MTTLNSKIICILGMHRSGTSCLTGTLEQCGLFLGDVINKAPYNLKGNKENSRTWSINDALLRLNDAAWDRPPAKLTWNQELCLERDQYLSLFKKQPIWGFKDPRCVLTLPFWTEAIPDLMLVGTFRHPNSVVESLRKRNGFSQKKSFDLWLNYNSRLLDIYHRREFPIISFDWGKDKYLNVVTHVARSIGLNANEDGAPPFFTEELRNQNHLSLNSSSTPNDCMALYEKLVFASEKTARHFSQNIE